MRFGSVNIVTDCPSADDGGSSDRRHAIYGWQIPTDSPIG